jgi:hypothetical protein
MNVDMVEQAIVKQIKISQRIVCGTNVSKGTASDMELMVRNDFLHYRQQVNNSLIFPQTPAGGFLRAN